MGCQVGSFPADLGIGVIMNLMIQHQSFRNSVPIEGPAAI